jgi:hypothetical protein
MLRGRIPERDTARVINQGFLRLLAVRAEKAFSKSKQFPAQTMSGSARHAAETHIKNVGAADYYSALEYNAQC